MELKSQAKQIHNFLLETQKIWEYEIMDYYPKSLEHFNPQWLTLLSELSLDKLHQIESKNVIPEIVGTGLDQFITKINQLIKIDKIENLPPKKLEDWAFVDVKAKKKHEIDRLAPFIEKLSQEKKLQNMIDIGGGVGHLARIVAQYYGLETISLDMDKNFQSIGLLRANKYRKPINAKELTFLNLKFGDHEGNKQLKNYFQERTLTIGLHTCGPLAISLIETHQECNGASLINFGCCYHKLAKDNKFPFSKFFKDNFQLNFTLYAYTLATRAHGKTTFEEFKLKTQVKNYRQALHLFLIDKFKRSDLLDVGEVHTREYQMPFSHYALSRLVALKLEHNYSAIELDTFYQSEEIQLKLKKMLAANVIRWHLGRCLEIYLLIDRVCYLEDLGHETRLLEFFEENISPRNLGIVAIKKGAEAPSQIH